MREELIEHFKQQKANAEKTLEIYLKTAEEQDIELLKSEAVQMIQNIISSQEAIKYLTVLPGE